MTPVRPPVWRRPIRIAIEMTIGFALLFALDWGLTGGTGFAAVQPSPYWLPVLVMALAYGTGPGVIAAAIASVLWLTHAHGSGGERDYLDHLFHISLPPLLWFVAAVAIGEVTMLRTARHTRLERRGRTATRNVARMTEAFDALSQTNRRLQVQVATESATLGHIIDTATRLSSDDPADRREAIVRLIALATRTEDFTCYRIVGDEARAWLRAAQAAVRRDVLPVALIERLLRRRGSVPVARRRGRAALEGIGIAAIPLCDPATHELVGCLVLHALPFAALNANRVAELTEIGTWLTPLLADTPRGSQRSARPTGLVA